MLASALVVNNLYKRFPTYWWTPADLSKVGKKDVVKVSEAEKGRAGSDSSEGSERRVGQEEFDTREKKLAKGVHEEAELRIVIEEGRIVVPDWMSLSSWQVSVLEEFQGKLRDAKLDGK